MIELHRHSKCTPWVHDLLDLIEQDMLVILSSDQQRKSSSELVKRLQEMDQKMSSTTYSSKPKIRLTTGTRPSGVLAELNETSQRHVMQAQPRLDTYYPTEGAKLHRSVMPNE